VSSGYFYSDGSGGDYDIDVEGIVLLKDNESFSEVEGSKVIIFDDSAGASEAIKELEKTKDIEVVFEAALNGHAEEISISKLVQFYLSNT
jgi:hypothetical protein